jgi:uncharacterized integral membrane protein
MGNFWLKFKVWTKGILVALLVLYVLAFMLKNTGQAPVKLWFWFNTELTISPLLLVFTTFLIGIVFAILARTTFTTIRQIRELRHRSRTDKLEREVADMKNKAAMLQTRPGGAGGGSSSSPPAPLEERPPTV